MTCSTTPTARITPVRLQELLPICARRPTNRTDRFRPTPPKTGAHVARHGARATDVSVGARRAKARISGTKTGPGVSPAARAGTKSPSSEQHEQARPSNGQRQPKSQFRESSPDCRPGSKGAGRARESRRRMPADREGRRLLSSITLHNTPDTSRGDAGPISCQCPAVARKHDVRQGGQPGHSRPPVSHPGASAPSHARTAARAVGTKIAAHPPAHHH